MERLLARLGELHPLKIDLSLRRCARLLKQLGDPQRSLPDVLHIAGTNGKGSTLACLEAILQSAGLKTHAFVSPHVCRFTERIRLFGKPIAEAELGEVLLQAERINAGKCITFFEIITAAAFLAFAKNKADVLLLETGLGGRLDATNLAETTKAAILTPIDYDHTKFLSADLATIVREKVGIAKPNALLVSARQTCSAPLEARARDLHIPLYMQGKDFQTRVTARGFEVLFENETLSLPRPRALGAHQIDNAALSVATLLAMKKHGSLKCEAQTLLQACRRGVADYSQPARLQRLAALPPLDDEWEIRLDGAHNPHAARAIAAALEQHWQATPYCLIAAMKGGKDVEGFFTPFQGKIARAFSVSSPHPAIDDSPSGKFLGARELRARAHPKVDLQAVHSLQQALEILQRESTTNKNLPRRLLITGSLYFAGEILTQIQHDCTRHAA